MPYPDILFNIDLSEIIETLFLLMLAFVLALPQALNREFRANSAGLRTFPLVAMAACAFMRIGIFEFSGDQPQARIFYGIITGIGFIGGGAILKTKGEVSGTATAASIWSTGAIGLAVAFWRLEIAFALSFVNFLTLWLGDLLKMRMKN
jgi:putative Mg2+ transporter-C (MgtC) family protein